MKKIKSLISLLVIITSCYLLISCHTESHTSYSFLIKVDSIHVPQNITSKTPFEIDFFGFIGPDGCYSFKKFYQTMTSNNDIEVEAWGLYQTDSNVCLTVMVYLNGHLNMTISAPGIYNLKIKQPDNNYLEKQLTVN